MLSVNITKLLNQQINQEQYSSNLYLQMSAWCDHKGYPGSSKFLKSHAQAELGHMHRIFQYVCEAGSLPVLGAIEAPTTDFKDLNEIFMLTLKHEKLITSSINEIAIVALNERDLATFQFLQWFVSEQHEEERLFQGIMDKTRIIGLDGRGIYFLDKEIGKITRKDS